MIPVSDQEAEALASAIDDDDVRAAGEIVDRLRARGATYLQLFDAARSRLPDLTLARFDDAMHAADRVDGGDRGGDR